MLYKQSSHVYCKISVLFLTLNK